MNNVVKMKWVSGSVMSILTGLEQAHHIKKHTSSLNQPTPVAQELLTWGGPSQTADQTRRLCAAFNAPDRLLAPVTL